jgi:uncharacterized membrane protein YfcA
MSIEITLILFAIINIFIHLFLAISGGKALVLRPLLIFLGFAPQTVISSAVISGVFTRIISIHAYHKKKLIDWKVSLYFFSLTSIGGYVGAKIIISISNDTIKILIGTFTIIMGILMLTKKDFGIIEKKEKENSYLKRTITLSFGILLGILSVIVGGAGPLFIFILIYFYGKTYITSAPIRTIATLGGTLVAAITFIIYSTINWPLTITLIISSSIGNYLGIYYGIKKGDIWVKNMTLTAILLGGIKLIFF